MLRHVSYCKVRLTHQGGAPAFFDQLPDRLVILKKHLTDTTAEALISYGPAIGANQDDIKRHLLPRNVLIEETTWYRTLEGEPPPPPDVQIGPSELPSMAAYVRKYGTVDGMKRRKAGLPL